MAPERPRPMIFALMRYSHDALRGAVSDCRDAVERGDAAAFASEWEGYCRFQTLHQYMEDGVSKKGKLVAGGLWAILDVHFDDLAAKRGFRKLHTELDKLEKRVADASKQGSAEKLKDAWEPYEEKCLAHFAQEEMAVTPNIPLLPRNGIVLRDEMRAHILPAVPEEDMPFFVTYATAKLEKHYPRDAHVRTFVLALSALAESEQEWGVWRHAAQEALGQEKLDALGAEIDLGLWGVKAYPEGTGPEFFGPEEVC